MESDIPSQSRLILIGGGTCSGKTTIAKAIGKRFSGVKAVIVSHDNYYCDLSGIDDAAAQKVNFDHPAAIDLPYLLCDVNAMLNGQPVTIPEYSFITHRRTDGNTEIVNADVLILEGIFALYYPELLCLANLKIFVDTDADLRLARRVIRDTQERGFALDNVINQYLETVKPMHDAFIEPAKKNADLIIPGEREFDNVLNMLNSYLLYEMLKSR